jgi:hypothetical protein
MPHARRPTAVSIAVFALQSVASSVGAAQCRSPVDWQSKRLSVLCVSALCAGSFRPMRNAVGTTNSPPRRSRKAAHRARRVCTEGLHGNSARRAKHGTRPEKLGPTGQGHEQRRGGRSRQRQRSQVRPAPSSEGFLPHLLRVQAGLVSQGAQDVRVEQKRGQNGERSEVHHGGASPVGAWGNGSSRSCDAVFVS